LLRGTDLVQGYAGAVSRLHLSGATLNLTNPTDRPSASVPPHCFGRRQFSYTGVARQCRYAIR